MPPLRANQENRYLAYWEFIRGRPAVASTPPNLQIARNNVCNFHCVYCRDHFPGNTFPRHHVSEERYRELLDLVPRTDVVSFFGISEFTVDPRFFELVELAASAGATLTINTNGSVCTPRHVDVLARYPGRLNLVFSIDAATPAVFLRMRGADFWRVLANVRDYVRGLAARRDRTSLVFTFVVARSSLADMVPALYLARTLGFDEIRYYLLHEYDGMDWKTVAADGRTFDYRDECVSGFVDEYARARAEVVRAADLLGFGIELPAVPVAAAPGASS
jgi:MoaA/NifB/PqqE/SkfB family radical SAM enzyme